MEPPTHPEKPVCQDNVSHAKKESDASLDGKGEEALPAELISAGSEHLHRRLGGKEIQLLAVGGAIGTCGHHTKLHR